MITLRTILLFAVSTQCLVNGFSVVVPVFETPVPESIPQETTTQKPTTTTLSPPPSEEETTLPSQEIEPKTETPPAVILTTTNVGPPRKSLQSCLCKECSSEDGCFIKHYRQYNYYYPNGQKVTLPTPSGFISSGVLSAAIGQPTVSSYYLNNNGGSRVVVQTNSASGNVMNFPSFSSDLKNKFVYGHGGLLLPPLLNPKPTISEDSNPSDSTAAENTDSATAEALATSTAEDVVQKDIVSYLTGPNVFGQTRTTVMKSPFASQQVRMSSMSHSQPTYSLSGILQNLALNGPSSQLYTPNYFNPVQNLYNYPQQLPVYQLPKTQPLYSVVV